eukprot:CAMPEP_0180205658 /NCGR_PEP_ID=MMETSP0987-20121128/9117_1 /TAXON_ID=697907 /ORGANISM="non described non described, Strain CCMP2293" /LENGTH=289 /DNA_ID=CAMNT_0022161339 /DNA_START=174 /DNA_END=1042 /DNA_ORIENTATION=-
MKEEAHLRAQDDAPVRAHGLRLLPLRRRESPARKGHTLEFFRGWFFQASNLENRAECRIVLVEDRERHVRTALERTARVPLNVVSEEVRVFEIWGCDFENAPPCHPRTEVAVSDWNRPIPQPSAFQLNTHDVGDAAGDTARSLPPRPSPPAQRSAPASSSQAPSTAGAGCSSVSARPSAESGVAPLDAARNLLVLALLKVDVHGPPLVPNPAALALVRTLDLRVRAARLVLRERTTHLRVAVTARAAPRGVFGQILPTRRLRAALVRTLHRHPATLPAVRFQLPHLPLP